MTREELLTQLKKQIDFLSNTKIPGMERADIRQELVLMVLNDFVGHENLEQYKLGWWFKRLKWHLLNLIEKEKKEPVNRARRYEALNG